MSWCNNDKINNSTNTATNKNDDNNVMITKIIKVTIIMLLKNNSEYNKS